jgi:hypothetical protein
VHHHFYRKLVFLIIALSSFVWSSRAVADDDGDGPAWRYATFLIHSGGVTQQIEGRLFTPDGDGAIIWVLNDKDEELCKGSLGSKGRFFTLKQLKCLFSPHTYEEVVLVNKRKFGVVNHYVGTIEAPSGLVGIIFHMGSEQGRVSTIKVSLKDINELYGKFPNWILPSN